MEKHTPGKLFDEAMKIDPEDARKYLKDRKFPGHKQPEPPQPKKEPVKDQAQKEFDKMAKEYTEGKNEKI